MDDNYLLMSTSQNYRALSESLIQGGSAGTGKYMSVQERKRQRYIQRNRHYMHRQHLLSTAGSRRSNDTSNNSASINVSSMTKKEKLDLMISYDEFIQESKSPFRRRCFKMRQRMILDQGYQLILILITGFLVLVAPMFSVVIIYDKFSQTHKQSNQATIQAYKNGNQLEYSDSVWPLIGISGFLLLAVFYSFGALLTDICNSGLMVWHRDNLGRMICQLIFHICLFMTLINLRLYLKSKERRHWMGDIFNDGHMDFYQCFYPLFTVTMLYICKLAMLIHKHSILRFMNAVSVIILIVLGESLFDKSNSNDAPVWLLSIPISMFMISQALIDVIQVGFTMDIKKRLFNFLDNGQKKCWAFGHLIASILYSIMLVYWLWIMHNNANNKLGKREDEKILHLSLSSFIFYCLFIIERVGIYVLDIFQAQFEFEMMK